MTILTDTDQMQEASNELSAVYRDMHDVYYNLNNLINYLEPTWQGAAATEYLNHLRQQLAEVKRLMDAVMAMKQTADERIRTSISLDRLESITIANMAANIYDIKRSLDAATLNFIGF